MLADRSLFCSYSNGKTNYGNHKLELTSHCLTSDWQLKDCDTFCSMAYILGRDRFASSGRGISSAGSRIFAHETIDQTETGTRWPTMFTFLRLQLKYKNG